MNKRYTSNYSTLKIILVAHAGIFLINYLEDGVLNLNYEWWARALLLAAPALAWFFDTSTWLKLTGGEIVSAGQFEFRKPHSIKLHHVKEVRRVRQSRFFANAGAYFAFYGDDGLLLYVREANFSKTTLKTFMSDLRTALPFALIDPQYEELIAKDLDEVTDFKKRPATHQSL